MSNQDRLHQTLSREIEEWQLEITAIESDPVSIYADCSSFLGPVQLILGFPGLLGCYELTASQIADNNWHFDCVYYYALDFDFVHEHERRHCKGYID